MDTRSAGEGERTFDSKEQANQFLRERFPVLSPGNVFEPNAATEPLDGLIQKVIVQSTPPPGGAPVLVARYRWVIKNEDLGLADAVFEALRNASAVGFFVGAISSHAGNWPAAAVGIFAALFKLCRNVLNKGGVLSPNACAVLVTLKALEPQSSEDLLANLQQAKAEWSTEMLAKTLDSLKAMPMRNGSVRALIAQDEQGRWLTADI